MGIISYYYIENGIYTRFDTFLHMRDFAANRTKNGRYVIQSPLRVCSYRREHIIDFGLDEQQARELNIIDTRE